MKLVWVWWRRNITGYCIRLIYLQFRKWMDRKPWAIPAHGFFISDNIAYFKIFGEWFLGNVPWPRGHPRTMKILRVFRLGLRSRSPFGLRLEGYVKFLRPIT
jgi:hypothetical protein